MDHQTEHPFNRHAEKALSGFGDLDSPAVSGEVNLRAPNLSSHLLETQGLKRKLEPVGVSGLGTPPHRGGLILHDGQRTIIRALNDVAAPGQPKAL